MRLLEFEAKNILASYGIPIPKGKLVYSPEEARTAAEALGKPVALKAQVLAVYCARGVFRYYLRRGS
jgi:succinyl-CoA synthetase beta subunit